MTGASSGIGRALALELARSGVDLVLLARRGDRLAEVAEEVRRIGRRAEIVVGDVTDPAVRVAAPEAAEAKFGGLDLLVNNAGVAAHGRFASAQTDRLRPIMEVNFFAPAELIRLAMPLLLEGRQPMVVNIGSILGKRGCPHKSEYTASKFALHGFSEALRAELTPFGVDVLVVVAGPTDTEHFDRLLDDQGELPWGDPRRRRPSASAGDRAGDRTRPARSSHQLAGLVLDRAQPHFPATRGPRHGPLRLRPGWPSGGVAIPAKMALSAVTGPHGLPGRSWACRRNSSFLRHLERHPILGTGLALCCDVQRCACQFRLGRPRRGPLKPGQITTGRRNITDEKSPSVIGAHACYPWSRIDLLILKYKFVDVGNSEE